MPFSQPFLSFGPRIVSSGEWAHLCEELVLSLGHGVLQLRLQRLHTMHGARLQATHHINTSAHAKADQGHGG